MAMIATRLARPAAKRGPSRRHAIPSEPTLQRAGIVNRCHKLPLKLPHANDAPSMKACPRFTATENCGYLRRNHA
jgi:hypothetical protein